MIDVLSHEGRDVLCRAARDRGLLAFDFDGTIAPIVDDPADAQVSPRTRELLSAAAVLYPCAVISGRARADLAQRLAGIPVARVVGNHGAEAGAAPPPPHRALAGPRRAAALSNAIEADGVAVIIRVMEL